jgi:hypothetical protein
MGSEASSVDGCDNRLGLNKTGAPGVAGELRPIIPRVIEVAYLSVRDRSACAPESQPALKSATAARFIALPRSATRPGDPPASGQAAQPEGIVL